MAAYRFFISDASGHFHGVEIFEAADDACALAQAEHLRARLGLLGFELWDGPRLVGRRLDPQA